MKCLNLIFLRYCNNHLAEGEEGGARVKLQSRVGALDVNFLHMEGLQVILRFNY